MKYEEVLTNLGLISEKEFNEVLSNCPPVHGYIDGLDFDTLTDISAVSSVILDHWLENISDKAWCDMINFKDKTLYVYNFSSLDEASLIKSTLENYGWTILNFEEELAELSEKNASIMKDFYLKRLKELSVNQLEKLFKDYDNQKRCLS